MPEIFAPREPGQLLRTSYAGYIFDWDGTLADSHQANFASMRDALAPHGVPITWEWFNARTGVSSAEMALMASTAAGVSLDPHTVARARDENYLALVHEVTHIDPVVNVLRTLHARSLPIALATGGGARTVLRTVDALGLRDNFTVIVTREDAAEGKPEPDIFLTAAQRLRVPPTNCLVYEDSSQGVEAATRAGMDVVDVRAVQGRV